MKNINKFIAIVLCLLLVTTSFATVSAEESGFSGIVSKNVKVTDAGDVKVSIDIAGNPGITAIKLWVSYDTEVLTVKENGISDTGLLKGKIDNTFIEGRFPLGWLDAGADAVNNYKDGAIAEIEFELNENFFGTTEIKVEVEFAQNFVNGKFGDAPDMQGGVISVTRDRISIDKGVVTATAVNGETLIVASYAHNRMIDCKMYPNTVGNVQFRIADEINTTGATKLKAFLWESIETMAPVYECAE